ncbi:MAG TPA: hypothetical protein ENG00_00895 [Candidatus Aenigmarchaeota archaeon]|nr:hypothetical protein [Candidatus Aenigmarchaeota archaeon]
MYIRIEHLQAIHYFYFFIGIFTLFSAVFYGLGRIFSYLFIIFCIINTAISFYVSILAKRRLEGYIIFHSSGFILRHAVLIIVAMGTAMLLWNLDILEELVTTLTTVNYFVFFAALIWYLIARIGFVKKLLDAYSDYMIKEAVKLIVNTKKKNPGYFGPELVDENQIISYKYGTNPDVDNAIARVLRDKKDRNTILEALGTIEISLFRQSIESLRKRLEDLKQSGNESEIPKYERLIQRGEKRLMEYEKIFYRKTGKEML